MGIDSTALRQFPRSVVPSAAEFVGRVARTLRGARFGVGEPYNGKRGTFWEMLSEECGRSV